MPLVDPKEYQYLYGTIVVFGLITVGLYGCLLRPLLAPSRRRQQQQEQARRGGAASSGLAAGASGIGGRFPLNAALSARSPPHVAAASASSSLASSPSLGLDGLVPFRQTLASRHTDDVPARERARILSRLLAGGPSDDDGAAAAAAAPASSLASLLPPKGGTWILSLEVTRPGLDDEDMWDRVRPLVRALGTYYNLLVVLAVPGGGSGGGGNDDGATGASASAKQLRAEWIAKLRSPSPRRAAAASAGVAEEVLPSHRVVASATVAGRVAFVRQVQRVGAVADFDPRVRDQLARFGHKVVVYDARANL
jgi:hypothetical protein